MAILVYIVICAGSIMFIVAAGLQKDDRPVGPSPPGREPMCQLRAGGNCYKQKESSHGQGHRS